MWQSMGGGSGWFQAVGGHHGIGWPVQVRPEFFGRGREWGQILRGLFFDGRKSILYCVREGWRCWR